MYIFFFVLLVAQLQGCAAVAVGAVKTVATVAVKAPIAVGSAVVDIATQSEEEKKKKEAKTKKKRNQNSRLLPGNYRTIAIKKAAGFF